jgi:hypothetical protein
MFLGFKSKAERQREIEQGVGKPPSACTVDELKARYKAQQTELIENSKKVYEEVWKHSSLVNAARMVKCASFQPGHSHAIRGAAEVD